MAMNLQALKDSFEAVKPVAGKVVDYFYDTLFRKYPEAKALFKSHRMKMQKEALIQSLVTIFDNLEKPEKLKSYLNALGSRHVHYGVQEKHYPLVAECLIDTLKYFFDDTWTAELEETWSEALTLIASLMLEGAKSSPKPVSDLDVKEELDAVLTDLMKSSLSEIAGTEEIRNIARQQANSLIKERLREQLNELKEKFKVKKAA